MAISQRWRRRLLAVGAVLLAVAAGLVAGPYRESLRSPAGRVRPGVGLEGRPVGGLDRTELGAVVDELAGRLRQPPQDAFVDRRTGDVHPERDGVDVDLKATVERVMRASAGEQVEAARVAVRARWRARDLERLRLVAGRYSTPVFGSAGRQANLALAAERIGYVLLLPGETFSFNERVGPYTDAVGWQRAPVAVGGRLLQGWAGGACQVSSTLYNAVLQAGLPVVERHPHSVPVPYVPAGRDAAVSGGKDFRFRNDRDFPVLVQAAVEDGRVSATLFFPEGAAVVGPRAGEGATAVPADADPHAC